MLPVQTTFGAIPIGTPFERNVWARNTVGDRRYKSLQRWAYVKRTHGTIAGFADGPHGTFRFNHEWPIYVAADLRLTIAIARASL